MTSAQHRPVPAQLAQSDVLVLDYLAALWAAGDDLAPETRDELMATVADYIAQRRTGPDDDAEYVLRLLGPPESLVAAADRGRIPAHLTAAVLPPPPAPRSLAAFSARTPEWMAVVLLTLGAVLLPGLGPMAGLLLMTGSSRWTGVHKAVAATVAIGTGLVGLAFGVLLASAGVAELGMLVAYLAAVVGPIGAGLTLVPGLGDGPRPASGRR